MKDVKTDELLKQLKNVKDPQSLELFIAENKEVLTEKSFSDYFNELLVKKQLEKNAVIKASGINRTYGYQILQGKRNPGKNKTLAFCIAAQLSLEETQRALIFAQEGQLYSKIKRETIIIFGINKGLSLFQLNELLYDRGEDIID